MNYTKVIVATLYVSLCFLVWTYSNVDKYSHVCSFVVQSRYALVYSIVGNASTRRRRKNALQKGNGKLALRQMYVPCFTILHVNLAHSYELG